MSLRTQKLLSTALFVSVSLGAAQTAPVAPAAAPAPAVAPKPATPTAPVKPAAPTSAATNKVVSAAAISVNQAVKGQFVSCPAALKVTKEAVCLYVKSPVASVRPLVKTGLGNLALGDWKMSGQASSLLVRESVTGDVGGYVLLTSLGASESLVVLDAAKAKAAAAKPATPAGVVKGQPYVLDKDLAGVVNVLDLGGGKYRLNVAGQTAITVTAGIKTAQRAGGNIELPMAPATDGKNLIFPVAALRSLGCTVTDAASGLTIACGSDSVGVRPIVF